MKKKFNIAVKILLSVIVLGFVLLFIIWGADRIVINKTRSSIYTNVNSIPKNKVGIVLGTAKYLGSGRVNLYFKYRIDATVKLYKAGKIDYVVVSGDNSRKNYNEPKLMKEDLVAAGIPENVIYLDYAGLRTLDSIVRMEKIFGQTEFTVISQRFHNERAVYIAKHYGLNAIGFNAKGVSSRRINGFKVQVREKLARVNLFIDFLINKQPKFLGEQIIIGEEKSND
ncbi:SanA protein [Dysgonomonadaceae bacterium PH5-43]|nr:SanA protein [Dysgonomonadaceae bacterium PH5-43]